MPKANPRSGGYRTAPVVDLGVSQNLAVLRGRRATLRDEIDALMRKGIELVTRCRNVFGCPSVVRNPKTGESQPCGHIKVAQPRGLSVEDRSAIAARQREIASIDATLRAFQNA